MGKIIPPSSAGSSGCCTPSGASVPSAPSSKAIAAIPSGFECMLVDRIEVAGGNTFVGTDLPLLPQDGEGPARPVRLADYLLDSTSVTNERFAKFVEDSGYVTEAEHFGWSAVFDGEPKRVLANRLSGSTTPWWHITQDANWRQPEGEGSSIEGRMDHPVVQVSWNDAQAFAKWAGGRLPTEPEWEHAARGGPLPRRFPWGEEEPSDDFPLCNIWQGRFPDLNTVRDGFARSAPVRSFSPNPLGLYNMVGNVWEWTSEPFRIRSLTKDAKRRNLQSRTHREKTLKGGSFLCHISYCYRYRIAARMGMSPDSASTNVGFRIAYDCQS